MVAGAQDHRIAAVQVVAGFPDVQSDFREVATLGDNDIDCKVATGRVPWDRKTGDRHQTTSYIAANAEVKLLGAACNEVVSSARRSFRDGLHDGRRRGFRGNRGLVGC